MFSQLESCLLGQFWASWGILCKSYIQGQFPTKSTKFMFSQLESCLPKQPGYGITRFLACLPKQPGDGITRFLACLPKQPGDGIAQFLACLPKQPGDGKLNWASIPPQSSLSAFRLVLYVFFYDFVIVGVYSWDNLSTTGRCHVDHDTACSIRQVTDSCIVRL